MQNHLNQTNTDINAILISTGKIEKRGGKIRGAGIRHRYAGAARTLIAAPVRKLGAAEWAHDRRRQRGRRARPSSMRSQVYLKPRVLIVLFLGFSSGLPLALSGSTLLVWMPESGVDLGTIGLFSLVGMPYTFKFLWAPLTDALDVPLLSRLLGRRRGWLVFTQLLLIAAIVFLGFCDPAAAPRAGRLRRAAGGHGLGDAGHRGRRLPRRKPAGKRAGRRHGRAMSRPIASACWSQPPARCSWSAASRSPASASRRPGIGAISAMARARADRHIAALVATEPERSRQAEAVHGAQTSMTHVIKAAVSTSRICLSYEYKLRHARLRSAVQIHRRAVGRDDRAFRDRSRLHAQ